ncbi:MAG: hypothetical protein KGZ96_06110 [Clostridia bacterium]|nr:hypothetical protein [Clostridia bacterium]
MPRRKCPACGSTSTVKIIYGLPTYEAFEAQERGELVLGGCCISTDDPNRICKDCGQQFGGTNHYLKSDKDSIRAFEFFVGGYFGISHFVYIDGRRKNKLLKYLLTPGGFYIDIKKSIPPEYYKMEDVVIKETKWSDERWYNFIDEIAACEVDCWKDQYSDNMICDGTQWSLDIKLPKRQKIHKSGSNAYPPNWKKFIKILRKYIDENIG